VLSGRLLPLLLPEEEELVVVAAVVKKAEGCKRKGQM
jgi:hypothetical protein